MNRTVQEGVSPRSKPEYDHEYGYPRTIRILWAPVADGASVFTVKDFKPLSSKKLIANNKEDFGTTQSILVFVTKRRFLSVG